MGNQRQTPTQASVQKAEAKATSAGRRKPQGDEVEPLQGLGSNRAMNRLATGDGQGGQRRQGLRHGPPRFRGLSAELAGGARPQGLVIQPKLVIGQPNDKYEREADRVAKQVFQQLTAPEVMRINTENKANSSTLSAEQKNNKSPTKPSLQIQMDASHSVISSDLESSIQEMSGSGNHLPHSIRSSMESMLGQNFSKVRIHANRKSDQLNREMNSKAFTSGLDIFFRTGEYNPEDSKGKALIAHELTHVSQQQVRMGSQLRYERSSESPELGSQFVQCSPMVGFLLESETPLEQTVSRVEIGSQRPNWSDKITYHLKAHRPEEKYDIKLDENQLDKRHEIEWSHLKLFLKKKLKDKKLGEIKTWLINQGQNVTADTQLGVQRAAEAWLKDAFEREDNLWLGDSKFNETRGAHAEKLKQLIGQVDMGPSLGEFKEIEDPKGQPSGLYKSTKHMVKVLGKEYLLDVYKTLHEGLKIKVATDKGTFYVGAFLIDPEKQVRQISRKFNPEKYNKMCDVGVVSENIFYGNRTYTSASDIKQDYQFFVYDPDVRTDREQVRLQGLDTKDKDIKLTPLEIDPPEKGKPKNMTRNYVVPVGFPKVLHNRSKVNKDKADDQYKGNPNPHIDEESTDLIVNTAIGLTIKKEEKDAVTSGNFSLEEYGRYGEFHTQSLRQTTKLERERARATLNKWESLAQDAFNSPDPNVREALTKSYEDELNKAKTPELRGALIYAMKKTKEEWAKLEGKSPIMSPQSKKRKVGGKVGGKVVPMQLG